MRTQERSDDSQARMRSMLGEHFQVVAYVLRRAGVPPADLDDEIQRTFIVASRRLETTPPADERRFLLGVAVNIAKHSRRSLARRREVLTGHLPDFVEPLGTPEHLIERKRLQELVARILDEMEEPLCAVLRLHDLEEMTLTNIAARLGIPRGTAASRLRRARERFRDHLAALDEAWGRTASGSTRAGDRGSLRCEDASPLERAFLEAGASPVDCRTAYVNTLAALGLDREPLSRA